MKIYLSIVATLLALALVVRAEPMEEGRKRYIECSKETGADLTALSRGPPNFDDPKMRCLLACVLKRKEVMADGKVLIDKTLEFIAKNQPGLVSDITKAEVTECAGVANEEKEECEVGGAYEKCLIEKRTQKH